MEKNRLNILLIEDNPGDARLVSEMLKECSTLHFEMAYAGRLNEALKTLKEEKFDVVLLDLNLPDSQGLGGVERITAQEPEVPVIIFTSLDDETLGIQAVRKHAADYMVKGQINSNILVRSIRYAIERKRAEKSLHLERSRLAATVENSPVGIAVTDEKGGNIHSNAVFENIWGKPLPPAHDIRDYKNYQAWWADTGKPLLPEEWASAEVIRTGKRVVGQLLEIQRFDGRRAFILNSAAPIFDAKGRLAGSVVAITDVTDRRRAEEALKKAHEKLEIRVQQRTAELKKVVEALQDEMNERKRAEQALKTASLYTRSLIEASLDPLVTISADGKVTDVNRATELVTGASRDKLIGSDFADYFTEREKANEGYKEVFSSGTVRDYPLAIRHKSGFVTDVLYNATLYRNEAGEIQGVFAAARDVTERNAIERRTSATNALLSLFSQKPSRKEYLDAVVDLIHSWSGSRCVGIRILDDKGYIPYESYCGFSREFWESESRLSIEHAQCVCMRVISGNPDPQDASMMTPGGSFHCEDTGAFVARLSRKEQARFRGVCIQNGFLSLSIVPIRCGEKIVGSIQMADNEKKNLSLPSIEFLESMSPLIGEAINRFNLEDEIRESESHLRLLSSQLLTVQEDERKRISAELHDDIAAKLAAIKFALEKRLMLTGKMHQEVNQSLKDIISMVLETIVSTRRIMINLRPAMIDDLGILATLNWYCREFEQIFTTIHVEKQVNIEEIEIPDRLKIVIFRIVQEGMNNIAKHSGANHISLALEKTNDTLTLSIEDNGRGFDVENKTLKSETFQGFGIVNMKERARLSGGDFAIKSFQKKGTSIKVTWPLKPIAMGYHLRIEPS